MTDKKIPVESVKYQATIDSNASKTPGAYMPSGLSVTATSGAFTGTPNFPTIYQGNFDTYKEGKAQYTPRITVTTPYGSTSRVISIWVKKTYDIKCQPSFRSSGSTPNSYTYLAGTIKMSLDELQERISDGSAKHLLGLGAVFQVPVRTLKTSASAINTTYPVNWYFQVVHYDDNYRYYGQDPSTPSKHVMYLRTLGPVPQLQDRRYGLWFDGAEPNNPDPDRQVNGNNDYTVSSLRQWLNSEEGTERWWSAQHEYDSDVQGLDTEYNVSSSHRYWMGQAPGFAYMCFPDFVDRLQSVGTARTVVVDSQLNRRLVVTDDKFFPMSLNNIGLYDSDPNGMIADTPDAEGVYFDYFKVASGVYTPFDVSTLEYVYDEDSAYYDEAFTEENSLQIGQKWKGLRYWYEALPGDMQYQLFAKNAEKLKAIQTNLHVLPLPNHVLATAYLPTGSTFSANRGPYIGALYRSGVLTTTCDVFTHKMAFVYNSKSTSYNYYMNLPEYSVLSTCHANQYAVIDNNSSSNVALTVPTVNYTWATCILPGK